MELNDLLPGRKITKLMTGSELFLVYFLRKYTLETFGEELKLGRVTIDRSLKKTPYYSFLVDSGMDLSTDKEPAEERASYHYMRLRLFTDCYEDVKFVVDTEEQVQFVYSDAYAAGMEKLPKGVQFSMGYISLVAFILVRAKYFNKKVPHIVIGSASYIQKEGDYNDILVLRNYGNCILEDHLTVEFDRSWWMQPEWEAFVYYKQQLGYMLELSTPQVKKEYAKTDLRIGEVLLYYTRHKGNRNDPARRLKTCFPCVVRDVTDAGILVEYYPIIKTQLTAYFETEHIREMLDHGGGDSDLLTPEDYKRWHSTREFLDYSSVGVDKFAYDEDYLLLKIDDSMIQDGTKQYKRLEPGGTAARLIDLDVADSIYAVFQDRGVDYDESSFIYSNFTLRGRTPQYDPELF